MDRISLPSVAEMNTKAKGTLFETLNMEILAVEDGRIEIAMPITHKHLAPNHYLHGGSVVSLADSVMRHWRLCAPTRRSERFHNH